MATYAIFRHGSNANNQPRTETLCVAVVEATTRAKATAAAEAEESFSCYANQYLEAIPWSRLDAEQREEAEEVIRENYELLPAGAVSCLLCGADSTAEMPAYRARNYLCESCR